MAYDLLGIGPPYTKHWEGLRLTAYQDTQGIWTVGFGHAHVAPGTIWTQAQADAAFSADYSNASVEAENCVSPPCWIAMGVARQAVIADMAFELGFRGLREFVTLRRLLESQLWDDAAADALKSVAAQQVPERWDAHAQILRLGDAAIIDGALATS